MCAPYSRPLKLFAMQAILTNYIHTGSYHFATWWNGSSDDLDSTFFPISEFKPQDADISLFFLAAGRILFLHPTHDDWYSATANTTEVHKLTVSDSGNVTMYRQNEPGSPLACREQGQFCFTGIKGQRKCTELESAVDGPWSLLKLYDDGDESAIHWLYRTSYMTKKDTGVPLHILGVQMLTARNKLNGPLIGSLPDNQWQLEVQHWHATAMADLQARFLQSIVGNTDPKIAHLIRRPNSTVEKQLCANQVRIIWERRKKGNHTHVLLDVELNPHYYQTNGFCVPRKSSPKVSSLSAFLASPASSESEAL